MKNMNNRQEEGEGIAVAIQGFEGSFHQEAAWNYFGRKVNIIPCATFREVIKAASDPGICSGGIMAIENSIAGSILPNYNLLQKSRLNITGEIYLNIHQNLMVFPGVKMEDIREVHSHHMAIQQCLQYLEEHNWKLVETEDTALSAMHIRKYHRKHVAAIASTIAAELFELEIIAPSIHTMKNNYTRFLVMEPGERKVREGDDKASVYFVTDHSRGSLARVLGLIADQGVNLSKLQSMPIPGSDWKYAFYADMEFEQLEDYYKVIEKIQLVTRELRIFGVYKKGQTV